MQYLSNAQTFQMFYVETNTFHSILFVLLNAAPVYTQIKFNINQYYLNNKVGSIFVSFILISMTI